MEQSLNVILPLVFSPPFTSFFLFFRCLSFFRWKRVERVYNIDRQKNKYEHQYTSEF